MDEEDVHSNRFKNVASTSSSDMKESSITLPKSSSKAAASDLDFSSTDSKVIGYGDGEGGRSRSEEEN